jgi:hypothetical protein
MKNGFKLFRVGKIECSTNTFPYCSDQRRNDIITLELIDERKFSKFSIRGLVKFSVALVIFIMSTEFDTGDYMDGLLRRIRFILEKDISRTGPPIGHMNLPESINVCRQRLQSENDSSPMNNRFGIRSPQLIQSGVRSHVPLWEQQAPVNTMTLPDIFELLNAEDSACIVCIRRIHRLGFKSVRYIRRFFSAFGVVRKVVLLPSRSKEWSGEYSTQIRPSSMCFVVLGDRESASRILQRDTYYVSACHVHVTPYCPQRFCLSMTDGRSQSRTSSISSIETCPSP